MDRRRALATIGLSSLAIPLLASCESDEDIETTGAGDVNGDGLVDLLFVQEATGVRFDGDRMTMVGLNPRTLFFADRPDEMAGYLTYAEFIKLVTEGPDSFEEDPPNATLVVLEGDAPVNVVVKLAKKPSLEGSNLVFDAVEIIQGEPPAEGGTVALFIDTVGHPASPGSVAGVHRRKRRRHRRHHAR